MVALRVARIINVALLPAQLQIMFVSATMVELFNAKLLVMVRQLV
jgi:hypothetical protein